MTGTLRPDSAAAASLQSVGACVGPIDWYFVAMFNFQPDVEVPFQGSPQPFRFSLATIAPATATAVEAAQQHAVSWIQTSGPIHPEPGVRDVLQSSLLGPYVRTGQSFAATAAQLQQLLAAIPSTGASKDQLAAASADLAALRQIVDGAATSVAAAQSDFAGFSGTVLADGAALQSGAASVQAALDGFGQWYVNALEHLQTSVLTMGADMQLLQDYATAYHGALVTLQTGMVAGISAADQAATALLQVAEQWATLVKATDNVAQQVASATAQSLASDLTALELSAAAQEWATLQQLAQTILTSIQAFPIPRPETS